MRSDVSSWKQQILIPRTHPRSVVGFFGFQHDRSRALEALAVSSTKLDLHGVFARFVLHRVYIFVSVKLLNSLVLITYSNMILALSGYQADEQRVLREVEETVSRSAYVLSVFAREVMCHAALRRSILPRLC